MPDAGADGGTATCEATHGSEAEGWIPVPLRDYPALAVVGGSAVVHLPEKLLEVVVVQTTPGCFGAVWRICTHGACEVEYQGDQAGVECPCHGSRFGLDGSIRRGPATVPLAAFPAIQDGETLWIQRWK
jgi:Rieske Fe-S protein